MANQNRTYLTDSERMRLQNEQRIKDAQFLKDVKPFDQQKQYYEDQNRRKEAEQAAKIDIDANRQKLAEQAQYDNEKRELDQKATEANIYKIEQAQEKQQQAERDHQEELHDNDVRHQQDMMYRQNAVSYKNFDDSSPNPYYLDDYGTIINKEKAYELWEIYACPNYREFSFDGMWQHYKDDNNEVISFDKALHLFFAIADEKNKKIIFYRYKQLRQALSIKTMIEKKIRNNKAGISARMVADGEEKYLSNFKKKTNDLIAQRQMYQNDINGINQEKNYSTSGYVSLWFLILFTIVAFNRIIRLVGGRNLFVLLIFGWILSIFPISAFYFKAIRKRESEIYKRTSYYQKKIDEVDLELEKWNKISKEMLDFNNMVKELLKNGYVIKGLKQYLNSTKHYSNFKIYLFENVVSKFKTFKISTSSLTADRITIKNIISSENWFFDDYASDMKNVRNPIKYFKTNILSKEYIYIDVPNAEFEQMTKKDLDKIGAEYKILKGIESANEETNPAQFK